MSATDADDDMNGRVHYFLNHKAHGAFAVDENTGVITTSAALDREKTALYDFQVFAVDLSPAAPRNSTAQVIEGYSECHIPHLLTVTRLTYLWKYFEPKPFVTPSLFR